MAQPANGDWPLVTVFGGSGFVGRHLVRALAKREWRIRVACRRPDRTGYLQPLGRSGQIQPVQANLRYPDSVAAALRGADAAVNLVGILRPSGRQQFEALHAEGAGVVARAVQAAGTPAFVHMSALGADAQSTSLYARTKAAGEAAVLSTTPGAIVMRPSVIFGPEDNFLNRFAAMARVSPALPLIGGGEGRFQPVFVVDVAEAIVRAMLGGGRAGAVYELGGPQIMSFRDVLAFVCKTIHRRRAFVPLPWTGAKAFALLSELVAGLNVAPEWMTLTRDQIELLRTDNIVSRAAQSDGRTLDGLGIVPDSMEAVAPTYLWRFRKTGQYDQRRPSPLTYRAFGTLGAGSKGRTLRHSGSSRR